MRDGHDAVHPEQRCATVAFGVDPVFQGAQRILGEGNTTTLKTRMIYAEAIFNDPRGTLGDLGEAVTTLEDVERTARRVLGGAHPTTTVSEQCLGEARAELHAREPPSPPGRV